MRLCWTADAWDDYTYWQRIDQAKVEKIKALIEDIRTNPRGLASQSRLNMT